MQGLNSFRYNRNLTGGNQELMEALAFQYYLEHQQVMPLDMARRKFESLSGNSDQVISLDDMEYLLGVYDMTGELMRFAITTMAINRGLLQTKDDAGANRRSVLGDLQELGRHLNGVRVEHDRDMDKQVSGKIEVMLQSIEKVEKAQYGLIVRESERWQPDDEREEAPRLPEDTQ
jgi:predicted translin family RNA/ssDNA-binding protein